MKLVPIAFFFFCISAEMFNSRPSRIERSTNENSFQKKLEEGYQLLKNEPNAIDTKRLIEELHNMEETIRTRLTLSPEENAELINTMKEYVEIKKEHIETMGDTIEEVNENSKVNTALFEGDMLLTRKQAEEIIDGVKKNEANRIRRQAYRDQHYPDTLWQNGLVSYSFYPNATGSLRRVFKKATQIWAKDTCLNFSENDTALDRIGVFKGTGCFSSVGRIGGEQAISIGRGCDWVGAAVHEIGHALGLFHTHSRHDRDSFINVLLGNIKDDKVVQFAKQSNLSNYNYNLTYDYGSIMHYEAMTLVNCSGLRSSKNNQPTIVPHDAKYSRTLGSDIVSFYDKLMINLHYKCLDKCDKMKKPPAKCQNGGFPHPKKCSKCVCPSGYGGKLCKRRPKGCGKMLTATNSFQTLNDTTGEIGVRLIRDDFVACNYWIKAPAGSAIDVVFDSYSKVVGVPGCRYNGVEIKTGNDKRHTGYRFCSNQTAGTTLHSTHNIVPVITYSRSGDVTTVLRYRIASSTIAAPANYSAST